VKNEKTHAPKTITDTVGYTVGPGTIGVHPRLHAFDSFALFFYNFRIDCGVEKEAHIRIGVLG
jgi:hypothetical protein